MVRIPSGTIMTCPNDTCRMHGEHMIVFVADYSGLSDTHCFRCDTDMARWGINGPSHIYTIDLQWTRVTDVRD
jgi:hypothetical protein